MRTIFRFKNVKIRLHKQSERRKKPQNLDVALYDFPTSFDDFAGSVISVFNPLGEKLFRLGTAFKGTHPALSDALQVSGIILAYNNH